MALLDEILHYAYTIWIVAFALYLTSATSLAIPGEILLSPEDELPASWWLSEIPFLWRGREVHFARILRPDCAVFRYRWGLSVRPPGQGAYMPVALSSRALRIAAAIAFVCMFGLGPILTWRIGLGYAVLIAGSASYLLAWAIAALVVLRYRKVVGSGWSLAVLAFELAICPPYAADVVKRLSRRRLCDGDGLYVVLDSVRAAIQRAHSPEAVSSLVHEAAHLVVVAKTRLAETHDAASVDAYLGTLASDYADIFAARAAAVV